MVGGSKSRSLAPTAIVPVLLSIATFALALIVVLAGRRPDYLEDYSLITVNTSQVGHFALNSSSKTSGILDLLPQSVSSKIEKIAGSASNEVAKALGVHDFYSAHLLTYCEGQYTPNNTVPATADKNVTRCSNQTAGYSFNPTEILQKELIPGVKLSDLRWSQDIDDGFKALRGLFKAMFVLYVIGIVATGLVMLTGLVTVCVPSRALLAVDVSLAALAFLALGIASGIVTAAIVKGSNLINKYGVQIGIAAYRGHKFLAITWAATVMMMVAAILFVGECCMPRRRRQIKKIG